MKLSHWWPAWLPSAFEELYINEMGRYKEMVKCLKITSNAQSGGFHAAQHGCGISTFLGKILCRRRGGTWW